MEYKVGNLIINIIEEEDKGNNIPLFSNVFLTIKGSDLNKIYQKHFNEYLGVDYDSMGSIKWLYQNELLEQLQELELENPDTDLDFLLDYLDISITNIDDIAVILKLYSDHFKHTSRTDIELTFKCNNPFEFLFVLDLSKNIDLDNTEVFYDDYYDNYSNYTSSLIRAFNLMIKDKKFKSKFDLDLYYKIVDNVELLFDLSFDCDDILDYFAINQLNE